MTIEIHSPELEELIHQRMSSGRFYDIEEALIQALRSTPEDASPLEADEQNDLTFGKKLIEVGAMVRGLTDDVDFSRKPSFDRPLELS